MTEELLSRILDKYHVPVHVQKHMRKVAAVSLFLGQKLKQNGESIDLIVLRQAALLHDFMKVCDFKHIDTKNFEQEVSEKDIEFWNSLIQAWHKVGHVDAAYRILNDLGEVNLANIIQKHRFDALIEENVGQMTWEEKLLYYADKRVKHDRIVTIGERLEDGRKRYFPDGEIPANDHLIERALYKLESEICKKTGIEPEQITEDAVLIYLAL